MFARIAKLFKKSSQKITCHGCKQLVSKPMSRPTLVFFSASIKCSRVIKVQVGNPYCPSCRDVAHWSAIGAQSSFDIAAAEFEKQGFVGVDLSKTILTWSPWS